MQIKRREKQTLISLVAIFLILAIDQCSKALVSLNLKIGESIPLIKGVLHITYVKNTGAAFGLFKNSTLVFSAISVVAVVFISGLIFRSIAKGQFLSRPVFDWSLIFILSGAMGNLIDRFRLSYVIDFIDFRIWPVFNIADSSITIGTILIILTSLKLTNLTMSKLSTWGRLDRR
ncbi:MAG: signal peptidase II [Candidatus Omnitrophica bacterium]|nr:signal peptidase II [Candidatus Omnitrophota bacterium]MBU4589809.1 signal peptidase II [Candidatus Omnitrophota bacterium]